MGSGALVLPFLPRLFLRRVTSALRSTFPDVSGAFSWYSYRATGAREVGVAIRNRR